jgi:hypothetical protein
VAGVGIQVDQSVAQLRDFSDSSVVDTTDHDPADTMKATVVYDSENKKVTATVEGSDSTGTLWTKDLTLPLDFTSSATYLALACASETGVLDQATVDELTFSVTTPKP